jgi:DNA-binding transcriptional ArsR family regulator
MTSITKTLKALADPNRLRILLLLKGEELSVAELQEILAMGQSTISTHLSQLRQAELVEDRRTGKSNHYRLATDAPSGAALKGRHFGRAEAAEGTVGALALTDEVSCSSYLPVQSARFPKPPPTRLRCAVY